MMLRHGRLLFSSRGCVVIGTAVAALVLTGGCPSGPAEPTVPEIGLSPTSLTFTATEGGANPAAQTVQLSNTGADTLDWTVAPDAAWLLVTPGSGSTTTGTVALSVSVNIAGLTAAGSPYTADLTVSAPTASNSPRTVSVSLTVSPFQIGECEVLPSSISTDTTLLAGCYIAESSVSVSGGATLTMEPGVTIYFQQGCEMTVDTDGRLSAVGTAATPIVFTGEEPTRGYWGGLRLYMSNSLENQLDYVTIEYGGGYWDANLYLDGRPDSPSRVNITNCTLRHSGAYGFLFSEATVEQFHGNTITSNTLGAGYASANDARWLDDTSTYAGNDLGAVTIWGSTLSETATWPGIDADYLIEDSINVSALLTIGPGARLAFGQAAEMTVDEDGALSAVGTAEEPIVFTGFESYRGYWGGLRFYLSNSTDNRLDYVTIEYGAGYWNANLYLDGRSWSPARVDITNCTLRNSATYGFVFSESTVEEFYGNTITGNAQGAGYASANDARWLDDTSIYAGNDLDVVTIWGSTLTETATWPGIDADYLIEDSVAVSALLTLGAGARLTFAQAAEMTVDEDGALSAVGTAEDPIVFTGVEATPGYWGGLRFYLSNSEDNQLDYATIEYGGGYWGANLYLDGRSWSPVRLNITNSTIRESATCGIYAQDVVLNEDVATANTFTNNTDGDFCP